MLFEVGMLGCKAVDAPTDANVKLLLDQGEIILKGIIG